MFISLIPSLKPCTPIDTIDTRFLNQTHTSLVNSLKKLLYIELYNERWFNNSIKTFIPPITYKHGTLRFIK